MTNMDERDLRNPPESVTNTARAGDTDDARWPAEMQPMSRQEYKDEYLTTRLDEDACAEQVRKAIERSGGMVPSEDEARVRHGAYCEPLPFKTPFGVWRDDVDLGDLVMDLKRVKAGVRVEADYIFEPVEVSARRFCILFRVKSYDNRGRRWSYLTLRDVKFYIDGAPEDGLNSLRVVDREDLQVTHVLITPRYPDKGGDDA